jgi:hypothetical protein
MRDEITIQVRDVYGTVKYYPMCARAKLLAGIAGTVTLTPQVLEKIRSLGFTIKLKQQIIEGEFT